jgi:hypothetical protein
MRRWTLRRLLLLVAVVALLLKADLGYVSRSTLFIGPSGQYLRLGGLNVNYQLITRPGIRDRGMFYLRVFRRGETVFHAGLNVVRLALVTAAGGAAAAVAACVRRRGAAGAAKRTPPGGAGPGHPGIPAADGTGNPAGPTAGR